MIDDPINKFVDRLENISQQCTLCPRKCNVDRSLLPIPKRSICQASKAVKIALVSLHHWEEPCLSGTRGAGTVFFSHCNLKCCFCQNWDISQELKGEIVSFERLVEIFLEQQLRGAHCLELVSCSHYADTVCEAIAEAKKRGLIIPIALNTNGYDSVASLRNYFNGIDVFLPDLKYFKSSLGRKYSGVPDYFEVASEAIKTMFGMVGEPIFDNNGLLQRGVIIRHLVLPSHVADSIKLLHWIKETFNDRVYVSLMNQYMPLHKAAYHKEINRKLFTLEYQKVIREALSLGIKNCYIQEGKTNIAKYIPVFDGTNVLRKED
ncbi:MAG: hypothetical protein LUD38_07465 [Parabacteroides sp.]|nr:hypothetical protein [Parabacteroides sp.]